MLDFSFRCYVKDTYTFFVCLDIEPFSYEELQTNFLVWDFQCCEKTHVWSSLSLEHFSWQDIFLDGYDGRYIVIILSIGYVEGLKIIITQTQPYKGVHGFGATVSKFYMK